MASFNSNLISSNEKKWELIIDKNKKKVGNLKLLLTIFAHMACEQNSFQDDNATAVCFVQV